MPWERRSKDCVLLAEHLKDGTELLKREPPLRLYVLFWSIVAQCGILIRWDCRRASKESKVGQLVLYCRDTGETVSRKWYMSWVGNHYNNGVYRCGKIYLRNSDRRHLRMPEYIVIPSYIGRSDHQIKYKISELEWTDLGVLSSRGYSRMEW